MGEAWSATSLWGWALLVASPFVGSFLGVVIRRLPEGEPVASGRSRCEACGTALGPRDLVPLASWLAARGKCRHCGKWIGGFYPAVELAALALAVLSLAVDRGTAAWLDWGFGCWLLALGWIDLRRLALPDPLTLPLIAAGLAAAWLWQPEALADRAIGAAAGFALLWAIGALYWRLRGREGLGLGDAKLLAAAGAWVGASGLPSALFGAAAMALVAAGALRLAGRRLDRHSVLPFGPFLAAATWLVWLFGPLPAFGG